MSEILIVPDVHEQLFDLDRILDKYSNIQHKIFLGDWFDNFTVSQPTKTAVALQDLMDDFRNIFILGNHDASYRYGGRFICSGFRRTHWEKINNILTSKDWDKFKLYTNINFPHGKSWLVSHAGLHPSLEKGLEGFEDNETFDHRCEMALEFAKEGLVRPLLNVGRARGGNRPFGGLTWLDWDREFSPIPNVNQLCGHSVHPTPRRYVMDNSDNWDLDTELNHVGIVDERGELRIEEV